MLSFNFAVIDMHDGVKRVYVLLDIVSIHLFPIEVVTILLTPTKWPIANVPNV
ncbi:hypothetical protein [Bifidobacterium phage PMBT6]|nr:hypothetical protein [Bifidobacterium phage PMBT6]QDF14841.1 hypothetical protein [Bifidobacterium phage PMBT6]